MPQTYFLIYILKIKNQISNPNFDVVNFYDRSMFLRFLNHWSLFDTGSNEKKINASKLINHN
jgi:hypothetical protein